MTIELRTSRRKGNYTPDKTLASKTVAVSAGENSPVTVNLDVSLDKDQYVYVCLMQNDAVSVALSDELLTGMMTLHHECNKAVAMSAVQTPPEGSGFDTFEFWLPQRRPAGQNLAASFNPPLKGYDTEYLKNFYKRPFICSNAWVSDPQDKEPELVLSWDEPQFISKVVLNFDVDYDHAMESAQLGHHDRVMPFCVKHVVISDGEKTLCEINDNHQGMVEIDLEQPVKTDTLKIKILETHGTPAALFGVKCYS